MSATNELEAETLDDEYTPLEMVAMHMAGHAVMAHLQAPGSVKFVELAQIRGAYEGRWVVDEGLLRDCNPGRSLIYASGIATEILFEGLEIRSREAVDRFHDFYYRDDACGDLCDKPGDIAEPVWNLFWWEMVVRSFELLSEHIEEIEAVASHLIDVGYARGEEVAALLEQASSQPQE